MTLKRSAMALCVLALVAAACGDDDDDAATGETTTTAGDASATTAGDTGGTTDCSLDEPLEIVGLAETTGEGQQAVPYYANGWQLAVDQLNAEGGICGQEVDFERLPISPTDNAAANNSLLSALDKDADVILGIPNSATVVALAPEIARAATPTIAFSSPPNAFLGADGSVGSEWLFMIRPRTTGVVAAEVDYLVNELGRTRIGLLCVNQTYGQQGCDAAEPALEAAGAEVVTRESHEVTDTNLTSKVLAMQNAGADGILAFTFPNTGVVFFNQMADNGIDVPVMTGAIAGLAIATGNLNADIIPNLYGIDDCAPAVEDRAADFAAAYEAEFGSPPPYSAAQAYDSLFIVKQAVESAGSDDKAAIADALRELDYDGACTHYQADSGNGLSTTAVVESFGADGTPAVEQEITLN